MAMKHVVREDQGHRHLIRPEHIETRNHFWEAFGDMETEASANWVVRFCQWRNKGWEPFTEEEVAEHYKKHWTAQTPFSFKRLINNDAYDFLVKTDDGRYAVTHQFIVRCFFVSPAAVAFSPVTETA